MKKDHTLLSFVLVLAAVTMTALSSCSDDNGAGPAAGPVEAAFTLAPRPQAPASRARGTHDDTHDNELINTWRVVFIKDGKVAKIIDRTRTGAVEHERFRAGLDAGVYDVAAFANISPEELTEQTGLSFAQGQAASLADIKSKTWQLGNNSLAHASDLIPMSGFLEKVTVAEGTTHDIEVVRMAAKIEVRIKNTSGKGIELNSFSFGLLNRGPIALMPDYGALGSQPSLGEGQNSGETLTFDSPTTLADGQSSTTVFYVRESSAATVHPTGRYFVTLNFRREDGASAEEHYAATDRLEWIQRNDHIVIPIAITDLTVDWVVQFYPPIGGYPAVAQKVEGDTHFFTFGTQGKFVIRPMVRDSKGALLPPSAFDFSIVESEGDEAIFTRKPAKDPVTGEIIGELGTDKGTAVLTCMLNVSVDGASQSRVRKLYIIRE